MRTEYVILKNMSLKIIKNKKILLDQSQESIINRLQSEIF